MKFEKLKEFDNMYVQVKCEKFKTYGTVKINNNKFYLIEFDRLSDGDYVEFETEYSPNEIIDINKEVE